MRQNSFCTHIAVFNVDDDDDDEDVDNHDDCIFFMMKIIIFLIITMNLRKAVSCFAVKFDFVSQKLVLGNLFI